MTQEAVQGTEQGGAPPFPFLAPTTEDSMRQAISRSSERLYNEVWKPTYEATEKALSDFWSQPKRVRLGWYRAHEPVHVSHEEQAMLMMAWQQQMMGYQQSAAMIQATDPKAQMQMPAPPPQPLTVIDNANGLPLNQYWAKLRSRHPKEFRKMVSDYEKLILEELSVRMETGL